MERIPVAMDLITLPLGSPTFIPPPTLVLESIWESDWRHMVLVAPESCIGKDDERQRDWELWAEL